MLVLKWLMLIAFVCVLAELNIGRAGRIKQTEETMMLHIETTITEL